MRRFIVFAFLILAFGFQGRPSADIVYSYVNYDKYFAGVRGAFVIHDIQKNLTVRNNEEQSAKRYSPCSTFDIFSALAGLQSGIWKDQNSLAAVMKRTADPYFQEVAANIGDEKMQSFLNSAGYGNKDLSGGIRNFWMNSSLQISPNEQVIFLSKLYTNQLNFEPNALQAVRSILVKKSNFIRTFSGRSGACRSGDANVAWFLGYLKTKQGEYVFATSMESSLEVRAERAEAVTRSILEEMKLL